MIGKRVKTPLSYRRIRWRSACLWAVMLVALLAIVGCSGAQKPASSPAAGGEPPPLEAGAEHWSDGALLLPENSPAVFVGRLDEVLDAAERAKSWLVAEPAMLGDDGEETARSIDALWSLAKGYLGVDPLSPRSWAEFGIDPTRPLHAGVYPITDDGTRFVASVEKTVREELEIQPGDPIGPSLRALTEISTELPQGTNARILRSVETAHPVGGVRVVVPLTSATKFLSTAQSFATGMGFQPFPEEIAEENLDEPQRSFWSDSGIPALSIRVDGSHAVLDILYPTFVGGPRTGAPNTPDLEATWAELQAALTTIPSGVPRAPAPVGEPSLALTFDQLAMATFVRLRGYRHSLEALQTTSTGKRDSVLLQGLLQTVSEAEVWEVAADELTGSAFAAYVGSSDGGRIGHLSMTMFAARGLDAPQLVEELPTLGIGERSAALGVTLSALQSRAWRSWFSEGTAEEVNGLDFQLIEPAQLALPGARVVALIGSNLGDEAGMQILAPALGDMLEEFGGIRRVEFVSLAPDLIDLRREPRLLAAFVLEDDADATAMADAMRIALDALLSDWLEVPPPLPPEQTPAADGDEPTAIPSARVEHRVLETSPRTILFGVGVDPAEFEAEVNALRTNTTSGDVLRGRLEPIALLSWLRVDDPKRFAPIDLEILAQRLGPVVVRYTTSSVGDTDAITLDLTLYRPPEL